MKFKEIPRLKYKSLLRVTARVYLPESNLFSTGSYTGYFFGTFNDQADKRSGILLSYAPGDIKYQMKLDCEESDPHRFPIIERIDAIENLEEKIMDEK